MTHEILALLWRGTLTTSIAICVVLALRLPLRRWLGAQAAYLLWALVPAMMIVAILPTSAFPVIASVLAPVRVLATTRVAGSFMPVSQIHAITEIALLAGWLLGAVATSVGFLFQQRSYVKSLGDLSHHTDGWHSASVSSGPALVGAWRPRIVLPADFNARYNSEERALIIAHERTHLRRGDAQINALATLLRCIHWFNPLIHFAASRFRFDQELACDALVVGRFPEARRRYADAMLKTQLIGDARQELRLPIGCHWRFDHPMKERIMMLKRPLPTTGQRIAVSIGIVALIACISLTSWAAQDAAGPGAGARSKQGVQVGTIENASPSEDVSYRRMYPPKYPKAAIDAHQSGRVIVKVLVDKQGRPQQVEVDMAEPPEAKEIFGESAIAAVKQWTFNSARKNGKAEAGWVSVPIDFKVTDDDCGKDCPPYVPAKSS